VRVFTVFVEDSVLAALNPVAAFDITGYPSAVPDTLLRLLHPVICENVMQLSFQSGSDCVLATARIDDCLPSNVQLLSVTSGAGQCNPGHQVTGYQQYLRTAADAVFLQLGDLTRHISTKPILLPSLPPLTIYGNSNAFFTTTTTNVLGTGGTSTIEFDSIVTFISDIEPLNNGVGLDFNTSAFYSPQSDQLLQISVNLEFTVAVSALGDFIRVNTTYGTGQVVEKNAGATQASTGIAFANLPPYPSPKDVSIEVFNSTSGDITILGFFVNVSYIADL